MKVQIVSAILFAVAASSHAQRATELYTPIGRSPGLSGTVTVIGTVESFDQQSGILEVRTESDTSTVRVTDRCRIYLDRSKLKERNTYGKPEDLVEGRRVEILYENRKERTEGSAEWIKIEIAFR
jgi:hypothetical protein